MLKMIWAQDKNGGIGLNGAMPWHLPEDYAHFKAQTLGGTVIMGRTSWDALPAKFRPLPERRNIVITHHFEDDIAREIQHDGGEVFSMEQARELARGAAGEREVSHSAGVTDLQGASSRGEPREVPDLRGVGSFGVSREVFSADCAGEFGEPRDTFIIGGASIYSAFLDLADELIVTEIDKAFEVDTYAPAIPKARYTIKEPNLANGAWQIAANGLRWRIVVWRAKSSSI